MASLSILFQLWVCAKVSKPKINCSPGKGTAGSPGDVERTEELNLNVALCTSRNVTRLFCSPNLPESCRDGILYASHAP